MYTIRAGTRMIQSRKNAADSTFTLYNNQLFEKAEISTYAAKLLRKAHNHGNFDILSQNSVVQGFWNQLVEMGFIVETEKTPRNAPNVFIANPIRKALPLTALNIELTNMCNLRCEHCYGAFPQTPKPEFVPFEWIQQILPELNKLHTRCIALTGGEATLHPQFIDIAMYFLEHGFELTILTNGYNHSIIEELLAKTAQYRLTIKVSLDALGDIHDTIRGNSHSYANAIKTIDAVNKCENVNLFISTTVLKRNIDSISALDKYIAERYPRAVHTKDVGFPLGNGSCCALSLCELEAAGKMIPDLFNAVNRSDVLTVKQQGQSALRCTGGISQCTLMPNGNLKICNAACDSQFEFKYNAYQKGLRYAWQHCGKNIKAFRAEKAKKTTDCQKCPYVGNCEGNDCRVLAWVYTGSSARSNPITCITTKHLNEDLI